MTLSIVVITNKEKLSENFLRRLTFADKILIVYETQKPTLNISVKNLEFIQIGAQTSYSDRRNLGLAKVKTDWVLFVDDDEIVSGELAREIKQKIKSEKFSGYYLVRHDLCFYQELKYGELRNQKILRLARNGKGEFSRSVHEIWRISGKVGLLKTPLYHQKDYFISGFLGRIRQYGHLDAESLSGENKAYSHAKLIFYPKLKFFNNYFLKQGYKDGLPGLFLAYLMSVQSLSVRIYQWFLRQN